MIGKKFGHWLVLEEVFGHKAHERIYKCECKCGKIKNIRSHPLTRGRSTQCKSCARTKHGMNRTTTYYIWQGIIRRCFDPNDPAYKYYGGRGITVSDSWRDFINFFKDMGERPLSLELDRIDCNGNYEKSNCRWVTHEVNMKNRRCSKNEIRNKD